MNNKKIDSPTDTEHITLRNTTEGKKQQKIEEEKMLLESN